MIRYRVIVALLLAVIPLPAVAAIRPSFSERYSAWHATHVVVIDAQGAILESWKGDLQPGNMLPIGALEIPKGGEISYRFREKAKDAPARVTGARTVLFLTQKGDAWNPAPASLFGGMKVSVAWIEKGQVFAYRQEINPGPTLLVPLGFSEDVLKRLVTKAKAVKKEMTKAASIADPAKRAEGVIRFLDSEIYGPYWEVFEVLGGCGKAALPVCRKLLADPNYAPDNPKAHRAIHSHVLEAMVKAAGQDARADLVAVLEEEYAYWKKTGPTLKHWWGQSPMTEHYSRLHTTLYLLAKIGITRDEVQLVSKVRDLWKSLPQLDTIGDSQIAAAAEAVLKTSK